MDEDILGDVVEVLEVDGKFYLDFFFFLNEFLISYENKMKRMQFDTLSLNTVAN